MSVTASHLAAAVINGGTMFARPLGLLVWRG